MRLLAVVVALLPVGCGGKWFRSEGPFGILSKPIETPTPTPASEAIAARVNEVGRKLLIATPFAGIEPSFQVVGHKDPIICHRDHFGVFISDSLAERCVSEEELAGVLASELASMIAERRNLIRMGVPEPTAPKPQAEGENAVLPATAVAASDAKAHEAKLRGLSTEPKVIAADLLKDAGYPASAQHAAETHLKKANRNRALVKQLAGPAADPKWSN